MTETFNDFFTALLFGSGSWLGLILIIVIILLAVTQIKYSALVFFPILAFLGLMYLGNVAGNVNFIWSVIICWITIPLIIFIEIKRH